LTVHHTRAFSTHDRPKQLSSMDRLVDYSQIAVDNSSRMVKR